MSFVVTLPEGHISKRDICIKPIEDNCDFIAGCRMITHKNTEYKM